MKGKMKDIEDRLHKYNHYYYVESKSLITDKEYDMLLKELEELERKYPDFKSKNSPTEKVGSELTSSTFEKVTHEYPMLSLSNTYIREDIVKFVKSVKKIIPKPVFILEYKFDGVSISLKYEEGVLVRGVTRGNGIVGEDITENIKTIADIPHYIKSVPPFSDTVRGEIVMSNVVFTKINNEREEAGLELYMNTRNTTSGTLRQHDPSVVKYRQLESKMYYVYGGEFSSQESVLQFLDAKKFNTGNYYICSSVDDIVSTLEKMDINRKKMDIDTDGVVIKVNDMNAWDDLGFTAKSPRYAIAFKFETLKVNTKLLNVVWSVGRSGKLVPNAVLRPVVINGSTVSRSTLHNYNNIVSKDLRIGDTVAVEKAAEIIPQVVRVIKEERSGEEMTIPKPTVCPCCGEPVVEIDGLVDIFCKNPHCSAKLEVALEHLVSLDALNIKGFGPKLIASLVEKQILTKLSDIYRLPKLFKNSKSVVERKVGKEIEYSIGNDPNGLLYGLGIKGVGKRYSAELLKRFCSIDKILKAEYNELQDVVGKSVSKSIIDWRNSARSKEIVDDIIEYGVNLISKNCEEIDGVFSGFVFVLTGSMKVFENKKEIKNVITKLGGTVGSGVSKNTSYLVYGEDAGQKYNKAMELGVTCLTEKEFMELSMWDHVISF